MESQADKNRELALALLKDRDCLYRQNYQLREDLKKYQTTSSTLLQSTIEEQANTIRKQEDVLS